MKHGAGWYKREPLAYLGGVQGMRAAHHAVYGVVIELCYAHGGAIHNDPKWISGWIGDMGSAAVRKAISDLIDMGKLFIDDDGLLAADLYDAEMIGVDRPPIPASLRSEVFERDGAVCAYCLSTDGPFHLDHILPWSRGGEHCADNLTVACRKCNLSKSSKTLREWLQ